MVFPIDSLLIAGDNALRTITGAHHAGRPFPQPAQAGSTLNDADRRLAGALMRVNHVGEVCAQALYNAQALTTRDPKLKRQFEHAAKEETDHLAWTEQRLPTDDAASRAVVSAMKDDEARHAADAQAAGAAELPLPVRWLMRGAARVMTTTAHHL